MDPLALKATLGGLTLTNTTALFAEMERFTWLSSYPGIEASLVEVLARRVTHLVELCLMDRGSEEGIRMELAERQVSITDRDFAYSLTKWLMGEEKSSQEESLENLRGQLMTWTRCQLTYGERHLVSSLLSRSAEPLSDLFFVVSYYRKELLQLLGLEVPLVTFTEETSPQQLRFRVEGKTVSLTKVPLPRTPLSTNWIELLHSGIGDAILSQQPEIYDGIDSSMHELLPRFIEDLLAILNLGPSAVNALTKLFKFDDSDSASARADWVSVVSSFISHPPEGEPSSPMEKAACTLIEALSESFRWNPFDQARTDDVKMCWESQKSSPRGVTLPHRISATFNLLAEDGADATTIFQTLVREVNEVANEERSRERRITSSTLPGSSSSLTSSSD